MLYMINFPEVGLLHSEAISYLIKKDNNEEVEYYKYTKNFSAPLTITTVDQLFNFVFMYEGFEMILATLSYSKLIIDEIQMYASDIVAFLVVGLKYITDMGGKFSIVTATFPDVFNYLLKKEKIEYNIAEFLKPEIRHKIKIVDNEINVDDIVVHAQEKKVLVIVNTVKKAQKLYEELKIKNKYLLHSRFIKKDRSQRESDILDFTKEGNQEKGVWITTQIVEASLDIDFDVLYTELSTLDGLFQRMGRIYRKRELKDDTFNIYVYTEKAYVNKVISKEILIFQNRNNK